MSTRPTKTSLAFISLVLVFLIALRFWQTKEGYKERDRVELTTRLTTEPVVTGGRQKLTVGRLRVYAPQFPEVHYGDKVSFSGEVREGRTGLYLLTSDLILLEEAGTLPKAKRQILSFYQSSLPEPEASLVAGITLGTKSTLPQEFFDSLKNSGTLHVVVASGMNVTLVASFLISVLTLFVRRRLAIPFALLAVWAYVGLVGLEAPIVRAGIMGTLAFTASALGRLREAWWGLGIAALLMLLVNPIWIWDLGFLLSFGATAGILAFEKRIRGRIGFLPLFREDLATTLAAQVATAPILFVFFGQFSAFSPLVNALVLWTIAPIMVISGLSGLLLFVFEPLARVVLLLTYPFATFFARVVSLF